MVAMPADDSKRDMFGFPIPFDRARQREREAALARPGVAFRPERILIEHRSHAEQRHAPATDWVVEAPVFGLMGGVGIEWRHYWMAQFHGCDDHDPGDEDAASVAFRGSPNFRGIE